MEENLLQIINHYGIMKQLKYLHTEYFELDEAIIDYENLKDFNISDKEYLKKHIEEEMADVMVLLHQIRFYYNLDDEEVATIFTNKIDRQLERIKEENNEHIQKENII